MKYLSTFAGLRFVQCFISNLKLAQKHLHTMGKISVPKPMKAEVSYFTRSQLKVYLHCTQSTRLHSKLSCYYSGTGTFKEMLKDLNLHYLIILTQSVNKSVYCV